MICERCGYDFTELEKFSPRFCIKCGEKVVIKEVEEKPEKAVFTIDEVCDLLLLKKDTVYQYVHKGKLPHFKVCGQLRFNASDIKKIRGLKEN